MRICWILALGFWAGAALAEEAAPSKDPEHVETASEQSDAATSSESAKKAEKEFEPPPGFVTKKRGKFVLYCKKDSTIGTRFKTERCYTEAQVRDYLVALEEQKRDVDRIRATCATGAVCAPQ